MRLDLPPEPYDFHRSTFRYRTFGADVASVWHDGALYRVLHSGLVVRISAEGVAASAAASAADRAELLHVLGAGFDLPDFARAYPEIYARAPGFRPPLSADPFESLVVAVTAQQISLRAACAIRNRFVQRFGVRHELDGVEVWAFPRQEAVAGRDLEGVGLSRAKIRSIAALAEADLDVMGLDDLEIRRRLTELPGIGGWTVDWFLARTLGRPGAFAPGDLGVRKAVARWFSEKPIWPEARVREACLRFGEHANLAVHYLLVPDSEREEFLLNLRLPA
jgi:3-methyladenine DNA glycosylase/8-oxoguanine DNA glycosylase